MSSDSQQSNVSLELSQETTKQILNAVVGYMSTNNSSTEQFHTEVEVEEGEEEDGAMEPATSSLSISRAVFSATAQVFAPESSQPLAIPASPPPSSTSSLPITPTNTSWPYIGGNGISPPLIDSPPPPHYAHSTSPLSHLSFPPLPPPGSLLLPTSLHPSQSICSSVPYNIPIKGDYRFQIALDTDHPQFSKTPNSVYSKRIQRMYIKKDADIPLSFSVQSFEGLMKCRLVVMALHKQPEMIAENLQCCIKHVEEQRKNGVHHPYHFVRSSMEGCGFYGDQADQKLYIALPFNSLQRSGDSLFTVLLKFPCFTSDFKRAGQLVQLIFTLELDRVLLGRAVLDVRVCASPGRDMGVDERRGRENGSGEKNDGQKTKKGRKRAADVKEEVKECMLPPRKITKLTKTREEFTVKTFPEIIPHVLEAVKLLESVYMVPLNVPDSPSNPEPPLLGREDSFPSVEGWLEGLGLSRYLSLFQRHGVTQNFQILSLSDSELKMWGVGERDRRALLEGIAVLQDKSSSSLPPSSSQPPLSQSSSVAGTQPFPASSSQPPLSQSSSVAGTQPFPAFEIVSIQARRKVKPPHN